MDVFCTKLIFLLKDRPGEVKDKLGLSGNSPFAS
jgi:hypothetical protein